MESPLAPVVKAWLGKIELACQEKDRRFGKQARLCMKFYGTDYRFMYKNRQLLVGPADESPAPPFQMTYNKVAEVVQLFGPMLYARNPVRKCTLRRQPEIPAQEFAILSGLGSNPMLPLVDLAVARQAMEGEMRAALMERALNFTPDLLNLKTHSRYAIDEALIKGMGILWQEVYQIPGTDVKLAGSFYDTVDNFVIDPDTGMIETAWWCARRCTQPVWFVEDTHGFPRGTLTGNAQSNAGLAEEKAAKYDPMRGKKAISNNMLTYWKVWSKMGVGGHLPDVPLHLRELTEQMGKYCYLEIANNVDYPLNLPPGITDVVGPEDAKKLVRWPTPFWTVGNWPFTHFSYHTTPGEVWPCSHVSYGLGELQFLNWAYSFIAGKIKTTCRDFIVVDKGLAQSLKNKILSGQDLTLLEIEANGGGQAITNFIDFLSHPAINGDVFRALEIMAQNLEDRLGVSELLYGTTSSALRSAAEAEIKADQMRIRPDDMAIKTEETMSAAGRNEGVVNWYHLTAKDMIPALGVKGAYLWQKLVEEHEAEKTLHETEVRVEAGSMRKPNREKDAANARDAVQTLFQPLLQYGMTTSDFKPVNEVISMWAKGVGEEASRFLLNPPALPMMPPPEGKPAEPKAA